MSPAGGLALSIPLAALPVAPPVDPGWAARLTRVVALSPGEDSEHIVAVRRRLLEIEKAALQDAAGSGMIAEDVAEELVEERDKALADRASERS